MTHKVGKLYRCLCCPKSPTYYFVTEVGVKGTWSFDKYIRVNDLPGTRLLNIDFPLEEVPEDLIPFLQLKYPYLEKIMTLKPYTGPGGTQAHDPTDS
jgi:hypothetical protein